MSQPQNYGGPPEGRDPSESSGESGPVRPEGGPNPQQPPAGPGPQHPPSGPDPQYPPQGPQQPPPGAPYPPGSTSSPYVSGGGTQYPGPSGPQVPGAQGPPYPPPGGPGGYQQSPYGPPPSGGGRRTGLIVGVVIAVGVLLAGVLGLIGVNMMRNGDDEAASDPTTQASPEDEETTGPPSSAEAVGLCLPEEPVLAAFGFDLNTACDSATAFWQVTNASDSTGATVEADGTLTDNQAALDLCGAEYGGFQLGELWKDFYFTYDSATGLVEQLLCVEAIGNPDASGRLPITPDTGACFDDSDQWWTVSCDQPSAVYVVVDTVAVDPPAVMTSDEADTATAPCSGGALFWQVLDVEGRTTDILCGDQL